MDIRPERDDEAAAIASVITAAFAGAALSGGNEASIVAGLREAGALTLSLVADDGRQVAGYCAFSPVTVDGRSCGWFGLGPVAVAPAHQRKGIGAALISAGMDALARSGARGCVVLGEPAYYRRFGFGADPGLTYPGPPPAYFQALAFSGETDSGTVDYHPAFTSGA